MSIITTPAGCRKLNRRLERHGLPYWVVMSSGDKWGKYLLFKKNSHGRIVAGAGWNLAEATAKVEGIISGRDE